jgi:hypothetical protein
VNVLRALAIVLLVCACEARQITFKTPTPTGAETTAAGSPTSTPRATAKATLRPLLAASPVSRLLSYQRGGDVGQPTLQLLLLADGRVISLQASGELFERRLTPSGTASLLLQVIQTGYFEKDAMYGRVPLPGSNPPAHGATVMYFIVANGAREVRVAAIPSGQPDDNLYEPSPARDKITALARGLEDLSSLPASAWAEASWHNYSSSYHRLFVLPQPSVSVAGSEPDAETVWPYTPAPDAIGESVTGAAPWRCVIVSGEDAFVIGSALASANAIPAYSGGLPLITASLAWRAGSGALRLQMSPLFPHESPTCAGVPPPL